MLLGLRCDTLMPMSRNNIFILLGTLIVLVPFIGLPISAWRILEVVFGACVFGLGLSLRAREARHARQGAAPMQVAPGSDQPNL